MENGNSRVRRDALSGHRPRQQVLERPGLEASLPLPPPRASCSIMPAPTIVFDLDGTLIDTAPDLIGTLNVILTRHDVAPVSFDEARMMIGAGVKPLLQRALAAKGRQLPSDEIDRLFAEYLEVYAAHIADRS